MPNDKHAPLNADTFLTNACLSYSETDSPDGFQAARDALAAHPEVSRANIWTAACTGDVNALIQMIDEDQSRIHQCGGPFDWPPLLYATYSRVNLPERSSLATARVLLDRGADPDAHWMWGDQYRFSAITGAFGEGESGPKQQPPHADSLALARLLLEAGANPNDSQALYNTMFTPGNACPALLIEYGLGPDALCNWKLGSKETGLRLNPQSTLHYQLMWAIRKCHSERVRILLAAGADATQPDDRETPFKAAIMNGHTEILDDLRRHGAQAEELTPVEAFVAALLAGDGATADGLLEDTPSLRTDAQKSHANILIDAASNGRDDAVRLLIAHGWDIDARDSSNGPLHQAAWGGRLETAAILVELGADLSRHDRQHDATPADWARHSGNDDVARFLDRMRDDAPPPP